jgi:hypothetical protein
MSGVYLHSHITPSRRGAELNHRGNFTSTLCLCTLRPRLRVSVRRYMNYVVEKLLNSREADSHSVSREIPRLSWNSKVHYCAYKIPPLVPIQSQMNPVHTFPPYFPKIHSNNITSSFRNFGPKFCMRACYMSRQSNSPEFDHPNIFDEAPHYAVF